MEHPARKFEFDAAKAARGMERALFYSDPALRGIWSNLSETARMDLFDIHRPDLARAYRVAIGAAEIMRTDYPGLKQL
jgi:hypothetical protein